jgi:hypothetical protein
MGASFAGFSATHHTVGAGENCPKRLIRHAAAQLPSVNSSR